jgi:hypothetical protein
MTDFSNGGYRPKAVNLSLKHRVANFHSRRSFFGTNHARELVILNLKNAI